MWLNLDITFLLCKARGQKEMDFIQKKQTATKCNQSYSAKQFVFILG